MLHEFDTINVCERDKNVRTIKLTLKNKSYTIDSAIINKTFCITLKEGKSFVEPTNEEMLGKFFRIIMYSGPKLGVDSRKWFLTREMGRNN